MSNQKEAKTKIQPHDLALEPETVTDLEPSERGTTVRGGGYTPRCGGGATLTGNT